MEPSGIGVCLLPMDTLAYLELPDADLRHLPGFGQHKPEMVLYVVGTGG